MQRSATFEFEEFIAKQSFRLSSELHVSKYELLFILNSVPDILEQYRNFLQPNFIPLPDPITITSNALYFHYYNDYNVVGARIRFDIFLDLKFDELKKKVVKA